MRHNKTVNHLGRQASHRKALMANMAASLIVHKRIRTTVAKAKALRMYVEPLITKSKDDSTHSRRTVFSYLKNKEAVTELFRTVAPRIADRPGGYTRILKTGFRPGDTAEVCFIELVDFNAEYTMNGASSGGDRSASKKGRTRRAGSSSTAKAPAAPVAQEVVAAEAAPAEEVQAEEAPAVVEQEEKSAE